MKIKRTKQCKNCPWKVSSNLDRIPGYSRKQHIGLQDTISDGNFNDVDVVKVMACHESTPDNQYHCLGWLMNQLGPGNNIALRFSMLKCENLGDVELIGEQHKCFEDTMRGNDENKSL